MHNGVYAKIAAMKFRLPLSKIALASLCPFFAAFSGCADAPAPKTVTPAVARPAPAVAVTPQPQVQSVPVAEPLQGFNYSAPEAFGDSGRGVRSEPVRSTPVRRRVRRAKRVASAQRYAVAPNVAVSSLPSMSMTKTVSDFSTMIRGAQTPSQAETIASTLERMEDSTNELARQENISAFSDEGQWVARSTESLSFLRGAADARKQALSADYPSVAEAYESTVEPLLVGAETRASFADALMKR